MALSTKFAPSVMDRTVGLPGLVGTPVIPMPTTRPTVLAQETLGLPVVVVQLVSVTPAAVRVKPVPLPVAAALRMSVVALVIEAMEVPAAMFVPLMLMPGQMLAVLAHVTVVVPFVVAFVSRIGTV